MTAKPEFAFKTEAEKMDEAADAAMADGDYQHAHELRSRARASRRLARERAAGVGSAWGGGK